MYVNFALFQYNWNTIEALLGKSYPLVMSKKSLSKY